MDAKSKLDFINSVAEKVAAKQDTVCPSCGAKNDADSKFCIACGKELPAQAESNETAAVTAEPKEETEKKAEYIEPSSAFAEGLPEWNIEPPQVVVRRRQV